MNTKTWPAPAKINQFLHITGQNDQGYHTLQTVFQFLDYGDTLCFTPRSDHNIVRQSQHPWPEEQDLVIRAAHLLRQTTPKILPGMDIHIQKNLPAGGGLGGGSSDAATTLVALNHLWELSLPLTTLQEIGLSLGADVPVFLNGNASWAEGIGEKLTPINLPTPWYLVVFPNQSVSTKKIFCHENLTRNTSQIRICAFFNDPNSVGNDCEKIVREIYPEVDRLFRWLNKYGRPRMSGTGSCVFLAMDSNNRATQLCQKLPAEWSGFVAQGMNRSPLNYWDVAKR